MENSNNTEPAFQRGGKTRRRAASTGKGYKRVSKNHKGTHNRRTKQRAFTGGIVKGDLNTQLQRDLADKSHIIKELRDKNAKITATYKENEEKFKLLIEEIKEGGSTTGILKELAKLKATRQRLDKRFNKNELEIVKTIGECALSITKYQDEITKSSL
jgi:hypothetical protein